MLTNLHVAESDRWSFRLINILLKCRYPNQTFEYSYSWEVHVTTPTEVALPGTLGQLVQPPTHPTHHSFGTKIVRVMPLRSELWNSRTIKERRKTV